MRRSVGSGALRNLDPFLLLDEGRASGGNGFPDHPHRGFETVSYLLKGNSRHEDCFGNKGTLESGDVQWMTAGRGILHCEMPSGPGEIHALQLWVNLSSQNKMVEPSYQTLKDKDMPRAQKDGVLVKIIAGESMGTKSAVFTRTPSMYLDFTMEPSSRHQQPIPQGWNAFAYILEGRVHFGSAGRQKEGLTHHCVVFGDGSHLEMENKGTQKCRLVLLAGQPLKEPIVQHGPFVMNTQEEIQQAFFDFRNGLNGFEVARGWKSELSQESR